MTLSILVPTRGRPGNLDRLADAVAATIVGPHRMLARLDDDDVTYPRRADVEYVTGERIRFAASVNELAKHAVDADYFAILGDDVLPETQGWDRALIDSLGGRLGVAYGSDGLEDKHGKDLPTHVLMPAEMFRRLGWVVLPTLRHLFADNVWRELGKAVDNFRYVPGVKLTHLHRWNRKAPDDDTYREANDKLLRENDRHAFEHWRDNGGLAEAARLLRA